MVACRAVLDRALSSVAVISVLAVVGSAEPASAQGQTSRLERLIVEQQRQLDALRREVADLKKRDGHAPAGARVAKGAKSDARVASGVAPAGPFVSVGAVPLSWRIPGTDVDIKLGGKVKADFIARVSGNPSLGAQDLFAVAAIDTRGTRIGDDSTRFHARETRFNVELTKEYTPFGKARAFLEGDFFGAAGNQIASNSDSFRLRHAFVEIGPVLAGQWWSTFSDPSAYAETLDFQSSGGQTFIRQGLVRYEHKFSNGVSAAVGVENPEGRVQLGAAPIASTRDTLPDFVARVRYQGSFGHVQMAGVVTKTNAPNGLTSDVTGYGGTVSGRINVPLLHAKDNLRFQASYLVGATRFLQDTAANLPSVFYQAGTNRAVAPRMFGGYIAFQHWWTNELRSNFVYSYVRAELPTFVAGSTLMSTQYGAVNLIYSPWPEVDIGAELLYGQRQDRDGLKGNQTKVQSSLTYRF